MMMMSRRMMMMIMMMMMMLFCHASGSPTTSTGRGGGSGANWEPEWSPSSSDLYVFQQVSLWVLAQVSQTYQTGKSCMQHQVEL
jgi:hypothetical protein